MHGTARWAGVLVAALAMPVLAAERDCFLGALAGGAVGLSRHHSATGGPITDDFDIKGGALGANAGCLWKANRNGYGIEADFSGLKVKGATQQSLPFDTSITSKTRLERLATLRAVLGYETQPGWFAYGTAGLATAGARVSTCLSGDAACVADDERLWGLAGGIGVEYAVTPALHLRAEYLFVGFAKKKFLESPPAPFVDRGGGVEAEMHLFRAGVTLHF